MNQIATRETTEIEVNAPMTPLDMLNRAVQSGASMEVLEKLMALQERWTAGRARQAFDAAVSEAKTEIPVIVKNREGHQEKRYADFAAIARVVDPILGKHGLSYRFRTTQDDRIHVTCILSHRDGHAEETTLAGPADTSGSKNAIQAIGSTLSYLQRYSLTQALGLATADDDDGHAAGLGEAITEEQREVLQALIDSTRSDVALFCKHFRIDSLAAMPASKYEDAMAMLRKKVKAA